MLKSYGGWWVVVGGGGGGLQDFSVSPRPLGFWFGSKGFGAKGLGPGLDNFTFHLLNVNHGVSESQTEYLKTTLQTDNCS